MAVLPSETSQPAARQPAPQTERRADPRIRLAQLSRLHDEAQETALLANLLGRAPQTAAALALFALATAALSFASMPAAAIAAWLALVGAAVVAIWRAYSRAIEAPFERATLKNFAGDLSAILFYAGFAWGAGAFLAVPAQASALVLFAAGPVLLVAGLLRAKDQALLFLAPVAALTIAAALVRPVAQSFEAAGLVILCCAIVAGVSHWTERFFSLRRDSELGQLRLG
jgi:hypothetical protein